MELYGNIAQRWTDVIGEAVYSAIHPPSFHVLQLSRVDLPLLNPRSLVTETFILPRNFYTTSKLLYLIS